ncbi:AAA family ATPase [Entomobacter blattae]|uniref:AAA domain protein n=1 Tax=Entomobacter blattae TaxID=2762277 RepID=A0A7H1NRH4_9PROT|nr:AAA family ATPase [Entomobacter blattae]QNT78384.1 AAA domain protein [Entomobacter blattae]
MGKTLREVAQNLQKCDKKMQLIYAFNGTGKTRLSYEFQNLFEKPTRKKMLYYNAFTEDLFYLNNSCEGEYKLKIQENSLISWILRDEGQDRNIVKYFQRYAGEKLTPQFSEDFSAVTFSVTDIDKQLLENIKISKGEERSFVWSIFYALIQQVISELNEPKEERSTQEYDDLKYIFIDDPVSSLDENHLIELAVDLAQLIKSSTTQVKFIVTTHNPLFYNVLYNESDRKKSSSSMLKANEDGTLELEEKPEDSNRSFSYHLFLKQTLAEAIEQKNIQKYHFTLLRNLYEKTAAFLGYKKWGELLPDDKRLYLTRIIHFTSHSTLSNETIAEPTPPELKTVAFLFKHLVDQYKFYQ